MYKSGALVGYGSTADAIRHTRLTGELVGGSDHIIKGREAIKSLKNWFDASRSTASEHDIKVVNLIIQDLEDALKGL